MEKSNVNQLKKRIQDDDDLYQRFGKKLEQQHKGKFIAISKEGITIISESDIEVLEKALKQFGRGNFAFRRIGYKAIGKWR